MPRRAPATVSTRFLLFGLVGSVLLAVPTIGLPLVELTRAEHATLEIADDSQAGTFYLGQVGQELAHLRSHALVPGSAESVAPVDQQLQSAIAALPATLDLPVRLRWALVEPEVLRLREIYAEAARATLAGQEGRARDLIATAQPAAAAMHDALDDLAKLEREAVLTRLRAAHHEARSIGDLEIVLVAIFFAGLVAIWIAMIRVLRRQARQLADYTTRLEAANEDLDAFAGRVAHDLKNSLGPIVMAPSLLREAPGDTSMVLRVADRTERCSRKAVAVIDSLLAFSRATLEVEGDEAAQLRPGVDVVLDELAPLISQLDVTIERGPIPDVLVSCNAGLLHIVLANLCGNAVKFLEGQPERRVRIAAAVEGSTCRIDVEDTGPGIPDEEQGEIFEPFFRAHRRAGTGIGLATARRIVEARGGHIEVESRAGQGARFRVVLPLAQAREERPALAPEASAS